jgi:hypothetical protein
MTNGEPQSTSAEVMREQRLQRNLKIVVVGLGALILLGLGAVIVKVTGLATGSLGVRSMSSTNLGISTSPGTLALEIPKGSRVVSVSLSGNRLAVHHEGPAGTGIAILDIETGRRIVDVKPIEALPKN